MLKTVRTTHPRGVRQDEQGRRVLHAGISIHAPARGATQSRATVQNSYFISIHAPARGATHHQLEYQTSKLNFNPRTREGCDGRRGHVAPLLFSNFNPRTREGCDIQPAKQG